MGNLPKLNNVEVKTQDLLAMVICSDQRRWRWCATFAQIDHVAAYRAAIAAISQDVVFQQALCHIGIRAALNFDMHKFARVVAVGLDHGVRLDLDTVKLFGELTGETSAWHKPIQYFLSTDCDQTLGAIVKRF
jgi:hypothetical protein